LKLGRPAPPSALVRGEGIPPGAADDLASADRPWATQMVREFRPEQGDRAGSATPTGRAVNPALAPRGYSRADPMAAGPGGDCRPAGPPRKTRARYLLTRHIKALKPAHQRAARAGRPSPATRFRALLHATSPAPVPAAALPGNRGARCEPRSRTRAKSQTRPGTRARPGTASEVRPGGPARGFQNFLRGPPPALTPITANLCPGQETAPARTGQRLRATETGKETGLPAPSRRLRREPQAATGGATVGLGAVAMHCWCVSLGGEAARRGAAAGHHRPRTGRPARAERNFEGLLGRDSRRSAHHWHTAAGCGGRQASAGEQMPRCARVSAGGHGPPGFQPFGRGFIAWFRAAAVCGVLPVASPTVACGGWAMCNGAQAKASARGLYRQRRGGKHLGKHGGAMVPSGSRGGRDPCRCPA